LVVVAADVVDIEAVGSACFDAEVVSAGLTMVALRSHAMGRNKPDKITARESNRGMAAARAKRLYKPSPDVY
jgi:hypothetical protein